MKVLDVPLKDLLFAASISAFLTFAIFLPAISDFGNTLIGTEDIRFFLWLFQHYESSIRAGTDVLHAGEIYWPYGVSLARTSPVPLQAAAYLLLPSGWGQFGRITALQLLSFILGGIFSFALAYRFTKSFLPSLAGMVIFNFSVFHFEKAIHHLNYSMSFPFLALLFLFYYDALDNPKKNVRPLAFFSLSLLLLALNELTVAIMAGFIIFLDIFARYLEKSKLRVFTPRNTVLLGMGIISSVFLHELLAILSTEPFIIYILPSAPFLLACLFIIGPVNAQKTETALGLGRSMLLCSLPTLAYIAFISIQPSYPFESEPFFSSLFWYAVPAHYLVLPSDFQAFSHIGIFSGLKAFGEAGIYLGLPLISLILLSIYWGKATENEVRARDFGIFSTLISFPLLVLSAQLLILTPFLVTSAFPLLSVLRVPSRFMLFALLFLAIMSAMAIKRLILSGGMRMNAVVVLLILLLIAERWPATSEFIFDGRVPEFYSALAREQGNSTIFIYPDIRYYSGLNEVYYQTVHGKNMSYGIVSRDPSGGNVLYSLYSHPLESYAQIDETVENSTAIVRKFGFDYIVVEKLGCLKECFYGTFTPPEENYTRNLQEELKKRFGPPIFEDDSILVFRSPFSD
ncbi:MAG: hypothetical protein V1861_06965 [Candidatus Micrarchaeota archaeon]